MSISYSINPEGLVTIHTQHVDLQGKLRYPSAAFIDMTYDSDGHRTAKVISYQEDGLLLVSEKHASMVSEALCYLVSSGYFRKDVLSYSRRFKRFKMHFDDAKQISSICFNIKSTEYRGQKLGVLNYIEAIKLSDGQKAILLFGDNGPNLIIGSDQHALDIAEGLNYTKEFNWYVKKDHGTL